MRLLHNLVATGECVSLSMVHCIALQRIRRREVASRFVRQPPVAKNTTMCASQQPSRIYAARLRLAEVHRRGV